MRIETLQLRVTGIAASLPAQYRFSQKRFTPKRNEPLRV